MKRPDFIIAGATRSGTQALKKILDHHEQIFIPSRKEHEFFRQENLIKKNIESCKADFEDAVNTDYKNKLPKNRILHGESEFDPERAHEGCPHAKIIFTLRDPIERAYAQFQYALADKKETVKTFEHAMESELSGLRTPDTTGRCWIYKNQYQIHLEHWLSFYPQEKILILIYEEWTDPAQKGLRPLEKFLGLENDTLALNHEEGYDDPDRFINKGRSKIKKYPALSEATREQLEDILSVDKSFIENLLGRKITAWSSKK